MAKIELRFPIKDDYEYRVEVYDDSLIDVTLLEDGFEYKENYIFDINSDDDRKITFPTDPFECMKEGPKIEQVS